MSALAQAKVQNVLWGIKLIPTQIEVAYKSNKCMKDPSYIEKLNNRAEAKKTKAAEKAVKKTEKAEEKAVKKEEKKTEKAEAKKAKETMKAAKKAAAEDRDEQFSDSVKNDIVSMSKDDVVKRANLVARAMETNKLIQYTSFYMTDDKAQLIKHTQKECEIINGIAALFDFGKIYESAGVSCLKMYDSSCEQDYITTAKYLLSINDIESRKNDPVFMEKLAKRKEQILAESEFPTDDEPAEEAKPNTTWHTDEDGIIHPVFVPADGEATPLEPEKVIVQGYGISDELFKSLEETFIPLLGDQVHRYEMFGNLIHLYVVRKDTGVEEFYTVDPGIVMGCGKMYLLGNVGTDTLFVSTTHTNICKNILATAFYVLRPDEIQTILQDYFRNMSIYRYVDMSKTEYLANLDEASFQKLGKKLTYILNQVAAQSQGAAELPRFRINYWNGIDDFLLISDPTVVSPLKATGETSPVICAGLMYEVKGDMVTQRYMGNVVEYHIDKYGDM